MIKAALLALVLLIQLPSIASGQDRMIVGVRADAPPFSYLRKDRDSRSETNELDIAYDGQIFSGYMVNICAAAIRGMSSDPPIEIEVKIVEPSTRFDDLQAGAIDVLCDPATIANYRLTKNVMVSQPVYFSGIGMASVLSTNWSPAHWPCIGPVVGVVAGTTVRESVVRDLASEGRFGPTFSEVVLKYPGSDEAALDQTDVDTLSRCAEAAESLGIEKRLADYGDPLEAVAVKAFPNHAKLAQALCEGTVLFSVGDLEIIARSLQVTKTAMPSCEFEINPNVFTVERYGVYVHFPDGDTARQSVALRFSRQLSIEIHRGSESILITSFRRNFEAEKISPALDVFFWNIISGEP